MPALDIVEDCISNGFRSIKSLREPTYFKTRLTRILFNVANDSFTKGNIMILTDEIEKVRDENELSVEEKLDLHNAIGNLLEKYRSVILL